MQERRVVAALSRPSRRARLVVAVVAAAAVVAADQVTKSLALDDLHRPVHLLGPLGLALQYNTGSAFSLFTGDGTALIAIAGLLAVAVGWLAWRAWSLPVAVAAGLVLGGAVGNLVDRVSHGRVVDFITLSHWPTFNVADSCITVGVVLVALLYLRGPEVPAGGPEALPTTTPAGGPEAPAR
ncbi:MAG: signal peptidase II [Acidimicrobiales bacterium]